MKTTSVLLVLTACLSFAAQPALTSSDAVSPSRTAVKLYYGAYGSSDYVSGTTSQSPATDDGWQFHSEMPGRMMDHVVATDGEYIYATAAYGTPNVLYRHAVGSTTWETMTPCPLDLCTGGGAIIGDTLFICGGYMQSMTNPADTLYKYSISGNSWTSAPGPFAGTAYNWAPTVTACGGKLYYMSGCEEPGATAPSRQVWQYTPGAGWAQVDSLNQGRVFANVAVYHDTIWLAGGNAENVGLTHTEFYDPVADTWVVDNAVFPQVPEAIWASASGVVGDVMFIASGVNPSGALSDTTFEFDFVSRTWSAQTGMLLRVYRTAGCGSTDGKAIVYGGSIGSFAPSDTVQFKSYAPPLAHDVGVLSITAPPPNMNPDSIHPIAVIKNSGANPESGIAVTCWIDSLGTRVYSATDTLDGPLAAGVTAVDTFLTLWNSGPAGAQYVVTVFTELAGDMNPNNDTVVGNTRITGAVFADTLVVHRTQAPPTIDGVINPWEWRASVQYDISDLAGRGGTGPQTAGTNYAYYMWDHDFVYFAMDFPKYTGRVDYDQFGPFMDEDKSGTWSTDSSEGNYWVEYLSPADSCVYRALLNTTPTVWLMGDTPGSQSVSSTTSGHLQFETKIPIGTDKWLIDINPDAADTVGYFQYSANDGGSTMLGWWPQSLLGANWADPQYYGPMIFDPTLGVEGQSSKPRFALYKASPSILSDQARISYYVAARSSVSLGVYDVTGSLVRTLVNGSVAPGLGTAVWNRTDNSGRRVADGTYFFRLAVDGKSVSSKAIVLQ